MTGQLVKIVSRLAALAVFGLVAFSVAVIVVVPRLTHGTSMTVLTGSMTPTIPVGSLVVDVPVDPGTLKVGDIATYQAVPGKAAFITHRIIGINTKTTPATFTFKGDANRGPDINPIPATAIRGKVLFHVRYLGAIRDLIHTRGGAAGLGAVVLAIYALAQLRAWFREREQSRLLAGTSRCSDDELAPSEPRATVVGVLPDTSLKRLTHTQARMMLRSRALSSHDERYIVAVDVDAAEVTETMKAFRDLGMSDVEVHEDDGGDAVALRRLREGARARTLARAGSDA